MGTWITRLAACALGLLSLSATAFADNDPVIYDITHFDVLPVNSPFDSEQIAYAALFGYRDASSTDFGNQSFRIVNWLEAPNHSFIVDVWKNQQAFEAHLAQPHSVAFRFGVQDLPTPQGASGSYFECCIGSPIDDRQYTLVGQFATPWTSSQLPATVPQTPGTGAIFVIIYVDFLVDGRPDKGQEKLVHYGAMTANMNGQHLLNFTVLQQVDRPNRYVLLEVWDSEANYESWGLNPATGVITNSVTAKFVNDITPFLGSPLDYRLNSLCGETYKDGTGCVSP
jgi:quinol monooxygenase YgiN